MNWKEWLANGEPKEVDLGFVKVSFTPTLDKLPEIPADFTAAIANFREQAEQRQKEAVEASYQLLKDGLEIFKKAAEEKGIKL